MIVVLLGGIALLALRQDSEPIASDPAGSVLDPTVESTDFPEIRSALTTARWVDINSAPPEAIGDGTVQFFDVVSADGVIWAVGEVVRTADVESFRSVAVARPGIWRSEDGVDWVAVDLGLGPLLDPAEPVFDRTSLEHVLTTDDGAVWAFGHSRFFRQDSEDYMEMAAPIAYRTIDGETWEELEIPSSDDAPTTVDSVDSAGDEVLLNVVEADLISPPDFEALWRTLRTTDGAEWSVVSEDPGGRTAIFENGVIRQVPAEEVVGGSTAILFDVGRGPGFSVATGVDDGFAPDEVIPEEDLSNLTREVRVWLSVDAETWRPLERPELVGSDESPRGLFAHSEGVLVPVGDFSGDRVDLWNVDGSGTATNLGRLPVSFLLAVFVHDGQLFVIGPPVGANAQTCHKVWVADFDATDTQADQDSE